MYPDFLDSLSPLTSIADLLEEDNLIPESSPWASPCRPLKRKLPINEKKKNTNMSKTELGFGTHKIVQSSDWHLSEGHRQKTNYRGLSAQLDPKRTVLPRGISPTASLQMLVASGYRVVSHEK